MRLEDVARRPVRAAVRSSRSILESEAERAVDALLAGPLPEAIVRSLAENRVLERVLQDPELLRTTEELVERAVQSDAFKRTLSEVLESPELRRALTQQAGGFGSDIASATRTRGSRWDDALERRAHALVHRSAGTTQRFGGLATRGFALVLDALLAQVLFLTGAASIVLIALLVGGTPPEWLREFLAGAGWLVVAVLYFGGFWSTAGQTPGQRLLGLRVVRGDGGELSFGRSLVRVVGLILAIVPLCAGFLPVLVDRRRRALQDFVAGTVVVRTGEESDQDERPGSMGKGTSGQSDDHADGGGEQ